MGKIVYNSDCNNLPNKFDEKKNYKDNKYMNYKSFANKNLLNISDFSKFIDSKKYENELDDFFANFYNNEKNSKRGIFVYGKSGVGKTHLIKDYLKNNNYDPIFYEPHEQRNKSSLQLDNMSNTRVNVLNMFKKEQKKVVIVIDEIENMNNGDKTGITSLIKSLKIKKNKKKDVKNINPIICISSTNSEKKIKELMDVCRVINIDEQPKAVVYKILNETTGNTDNKLVNIVSGNLHKLKIILNYFSKITFEKKSRHSYSDNSSDDDDSKDTTFANYFFDSSESTKEIVHKLYTNNYDINNHKKIISDNDRTIINLIWHENITHILNEIKDKRKRIIIYKNILDNICIGDLMDRVIFQNQIWYLGEYSSLLKTFYNNYIIHLHMNENIIKKIKNKEIEFTKVLTKYSTEYNNNIFITQLCEKLLIDKKDLFWFFTNVVKNDEDKNEIPIKITKYKSDKDEKSEKSDKDEKSEKGEKSEKDELIEIPNNISVYNKLNDYEITKLDINRIKKLISCILGEN
jgi:hypothetical protein